jgi:hypothetical protein
MLLAIFSEKYPVRAAGRYRRSPGLAKQLKILLRYTQCAGNGQIR